MVQMCTWYIFCPCFCVWKNACLSWMERFIVIRCPHLKSICPNIYIFAALYTWNIQFAATSDVCHCDYSAASCFVCHFIIVQYMFLLGLCMSMSVGEMSMSKWDGAFYRYQMPTVEIHIMWDGARLNCLLFSDCPNNYIFAVLLWNIQFDYSSALCLAWYFIIVQYVFVRFSSFRYVDVNGSRIANVHGATQMLLVCVL
jgi:hypothetical protein